MSDPIVSTVSTSQLGGEPNVKIRRRSFDKVEELHEALKEIFAKYDLHYSHPEHNNCEFDKPTSDFLISKGKTHWFFGFTAQKVFMHLKVSFLEGCFYGTIYGNKNLQMVEEILKVFSDLGYKGSPTLTHGSHDWPWDM